MYEALSKYIDIQGQMFDHLCGRLHTIDGWIGENRWRLEWKLIVVMILQCIILWRVW